MAHASTETRFALLCALLGANISPELTLWTLRLADIVSGGVAAGIVLLIVVLLTDRAGLSGLWVRRDPEASA
ncbi:MAG: hypothetical protein WAZ50_02790 [Minisyncoccia bacterium]